MKKVIAFGVAFLLFLGTATVGHFMSAGSLKFNNRAFGEWINGKKFYSHEAVIANLNQDTVVVFGSSELRHMRRTKYHPSRMFDGQKLNLMLMGSGYYQSLSHAIELGAIEPGMKNRKVVLILSPQWFRRPGVPSNAFATRFSEDNFIAMLENDRLSSEVKEYMIDRTEKLLVHDLATMKRVRVYEKVLLDQDPDTSDKIHYQIYSALIHERAALGVTTLANLEGLNKPEKVVTINKPINWKAYLKDAEISGKKSTTNNPFYVNNAYYNWHILPQLKERKNSGLEGSYAVSPEYDDLRAFLQVCKDLGIEPLLVNVPVNGWWYDYNGFPKEEMKKYNDNIRTIAKEYEVQLADYSGEAYNPYFLVDTIHLGWKGWVKVNEAIYNYAGENEV